jgi:hypothetical protein
MPVVKTVFIERNVLPYYAATHRTAIQRFQGA